MGFRKPFGILNCILVLIMLAWSSCHSGTSDNRWSAPADAAQVKNPLYDTLMAMQNGKELYNVYCWSCHGEAGFGDGAAGGALGQKPANFHEPHVQGQKDGALFWKMSTGNGNMPAFKKVLSDTQRWQLVSYIRRLSTQPAPLVPPRSLRPDVAVTHFMAVGPQAVRLFQNPISHTLYYTTFDGDVFRISQDSTQPKAEKILSVADHGITRLQGAAFYKNILFLCGNVDANNKKGTKGRMVRFDLDSLPKGASVVFTTVEYGANKTIFDHGWNALEISPDGTAIFVNSGARTDHGEVQDNGGLYPNARDNALTSKIFRFPIDAKDLYLTDNEATLKGAGYIYAEGIRNAYDMAFDKKRNLFAVVNSADYDMPEDMFWIRQGHHYGFPWIMGGVENPQQYADWQPSPETDLFISKFSHSWEVKYFHTDTAFPKVPPGVKFSPGVQNIGPDANEYRGHSGKILDGDQTGVAVSTFTPHACPIGLVFDTHHTLAGGFNGDGFVIRYSNGANSPMIMPFTNQGADLLHLHLTYDSTADNYIVRTTRILEGFKEPSDAVLVGNNLYVIEYGGKGGNIWKITLPAAAEKMLVKGASRKLH
jgi:glucose/arabinose dehydrogenase/mono/diheme cytochrome c family protein